MTSDPLQLFNPTQPRQGPRLPSAKAPESHPAALARCLPLVALLTIFSVFWPDVAAACPGCTSTSEENRIAFLVTTGILTFLPLMLIGGFVYWLRKRVMSFEP